MARPAMTMMRMPAMLTKTKSHISILYYILSCLIVLLTGKLVHKAIKLDSDRVKDTMDQDDTNIDTILHVY